MYGLVHEDIGDEVEMFREATGWTRAISLQHDLSKTFFPLKSKGVLDTIATLFALNSLSNTYRALTNGHTGNGAGDLHMRGGVVVMGPGDQGVLYEHWEVEEFGTPYDLDAIRAAIAKFDKRPSEGPPSDAEAERARL